MPIKKVVYFKTHFVIYDFIFYLQVVEDLTPGIKLLLKIVFNVCPYVQCGIIIALIVAGLTYIAAALFQCFRIPTSAITSTAAMVATTIIPSGTNNSGCNKMLALAEETKKKARRLSMAHVSFVPLLPSPQPQGERLQEEEQLLEMELELGEQQELLDMEIELELQEQQKESTTFYYPNLWDRS